MKISLAYEMQRPSLDDQKVVDETIEQCVAADAAGFSTVWFVEHHFLTGFSSSPCPEVILGALSLLTKQIRLGFGVVILPYHHPVRVAERIAMVDLLSKGRVEFGTGRSAPYEQTGLGIDPRNTRDMWEESLTMIPKIWESDMFEWEGRFWNVPPRRVLPKPYQKPHPPMWVAALQPATYAIAAQKGIGVMALGVSAPSVLEPHIKEYKQNVQKADPVGAFINDRWLSGAVGFCGEDDRSARQMGEKSLKTFFGPDRPYLQDQVNVYETLVKAWGGVPEHLAQNFSRYVKNENGDENGDGQAQQELDLSGGSALAQKAWAELDADTLCERGVIVAGDPDTCSKALKLHQAAGVDEVQFLMATESVPHEQVMKSIELFGKYIIPAFDEVPAAV